MADRAPVADRVRVRAGGRSAQVRRAVGEATLALLSEGNLGFTIAEVAERAGVGRRTVYRWWPTQTDLLIEALAAHVRTVPQAPDTGSWEADLRGLAHAVGEFAAEPIEVAIASIMAGRAHPAFNDLVVQQWEPIMGTWREVIARAIDRDEAAPGHSPSAVLNTLLAPLFLAPLTLGRPMLAADIDALVALVLDATRPRSPQGPAR